MLEYTSMLNTKHSLIQCESLQTWYHDGTNRCYIFWFPISHQLQRPQRHLLDIVCICHSEATKATVHLSNLLEDFKGNIGQWGREEKVREIFAGQNSFVWPSSTKFHCLQACLSAPVTDLCWFVSLNCVYTLLDLPSLQVYILSSPDFYGVDTEDFRFSISRHKISDQNFDKPASASRALMKIGMKAISSYVLYILVPPASVSQS